MARKLTEQQQLFLEVLFDQADGNIVEAKRMAGYSDNYPTSSLVKVLKDEIVEATRDYVARSGPKAAIGLVGILNNPLQLGAKEVLSAAKEILDRAGVNKTEKIELGGSGIFILPRKEDVDDED